MIATKDEIKIVRHMIKLLENKDRKDDRVQIEMDAIIKESNNIGDNFCIPSKGIFINLSTTEAMMFRTLYIQYRLEIARAPEDRAFKIEGL